MPNKVLVLIGFSSGVVEDSGNNIADIDTLQITPEVMR